MTALVWQGMLNKQFGVINRRFGWSIPWLDGQWLHRPTSRSCSSTCGSASRTCSWSAPARCRASRRDLKEAAFVDGATGFKAFRRHHLPAAARRRGAAAHRELRVQLQQLQPHLPAHRGQAAGPGSDDGRTDILISATQDRLRRRPGRRLRPGRGRLRDHLHPGRASSRRSASASPAASRRCADDARHVTAAKSNGSTRPSSSCRSPAPTAASLLAGARAGARGRWFTDTGWRHVVALVALVFALFPVFWVISAAFSTEGLASQQLIPDELVARQLPDAHDGAGHPRSGGGSRNSMVVGVVTALEHGVPLRAGGLRVLPPALQGPARRPADPAADPDVPDRAGRRGHLPVHGAR